MCFGFRAPTARAEASPVCRSFVRIGGPSMLRIGVDVGGTNTDAVLVAGRDVVHAVKTPTTADVTGGIIAALAKLGEHPEVARGDLDAVVIGTTHFVNAVVQRRGLGRVAAIRIGLPAAASLPPFCDWPPDLAGQVCAELFMLEGGHDYDGRPIVPFDEAGMRRVAQRIRGCGIDAVAVAAIFSPIDRSCEERARAILAEECPHAAVTLSADLGRIGLLERENAALLNAALVSPARNVVAGFRQAIAASGITAPLYLTQNDGTVLDASAAMALPVMTFASGPTNSMRGAAVLSGLADAIVVDVGALRPMSERCATAFRARPMPRSRSAGCGPCSACPTLFRSRLAAAALSARYRLRSGRRASVTGSPMRRWCLAGRRRRRPMPRSRPVLPRSAIADGLPHFRRISHRRWWRSPDRGSKMSSTASRPRRARCR